MQKRQYETLMLMTPLVSDEQLSDLNTTLSQMLSEKDGELISYDKWGRYRLAYPVRKQEYGTYVLARYEVGDVDSFFKGFEHHLRVRCESFIMRHTNVLLEKGNARDQYARPFSMEEQPRDVEGMSRGSRRRDGGYGGYRAGASAPQSTPSAEPEVAQESQEESQASEE